MSVVKLHIHNRDFEIECGLGQEHYLANLANELDRRIKANVQNFGDNNTNLLYVVTALQILDEMHEKAAKPNTSSNINLNDEINKASAENLAIVANRVEQIISKLTAA